MGIFEPFKRRKIPALTEEQQHKLANITNPQQRQALLDAITQGEEIPDYAWHPIPATLDVVSNPSMQRIVAGLDKLAQEESRTIPEIIGDLHPGWKYTRAAEQLRLCVSHATNYLGSPVDIAPRCQPLDGNLPLATWGYFNPIGPTLCTVTLDPVPESADFLLVFRVDHPFSPACTAYGLLPEPVVHDTQARLHVLRDFFRHNGTSEHPLFENCPTFFSFPDHLVLSPEEIKELVLIALQVVEGIDYTKTC